MSIRLLTCVSSLVVLASGLSAGSDWPEFHGPLGNGSSPETGLLKTWGEEGPPVTWKHEIGPGYGGAAVRDGEVYILDREFGEADILRCFDLASGEELWSFKYEAKGRLSYPGSRSVPTVGEEYIYTIGGFGHIYCIDRETHEPEWSINVVDEYDGQMPGWGYSQSAVVWEDLVIVAALGPEAGLVALDRFTGDEVWRTPALGSTHSSPRILELAGVEQILFVTGGAAAGGGRGHGAQGNRGGGGFPGGFGGRGGSGGGGGGKLSSFDPVTGDELWTQDIGGRNPIVAPLQVSDTKILVTGGSTQLLEISENDGEFAIKELASAEGSSQLHLPVVHDGHFYLISGGGFGGGGGGRGGFGGRGGAGRGGGESSGGEAGSGGGETTEGGGTAGGRGVGGRGGDTVGGNAGGRSAGGRGGRPQAGGQDQGGRRRGRGGPTGQLVCVDLNGTEKWRSGEGATYGSGNVLLADGVLYIQDGYTGALRVVRPNPDSYEQLAEAKLFEAEGNRGDQQSWAPMAISNGRLLIRSQNELQCVDLRPAEGSHP